MGYLDGVLDSSVLSIREIERAQYYIGELEKVVDADSLDGVENAEAMIFAGAYFLLFELTYAHPGEVPPLFPE